MNDDIPDYIAERKKSAGFTELPKEPEAGAGRGFVNPPEEGAPPPQAPRSAATKKAPTTAENQAAFIQAMKDAKQRVMDLNFGNVEPRHIGYGAGLLTGPTRFAQSAVQAFDPLAVKERLAQLAARQAAVSGGPQHGIVGFRANDPMASGSENYLRKVPGGSQLPANLLAQAEDMSKGHPSGKGAWDIAEKDADAMRKIAALTGEGTYSLQGEGVAPPNPKPVQLMLPEGVNYTPSSSASTGALPVAEEASALSKLKNAASVPLDYARGVLAHPAVNAGLHAANILGTGAQAISDVYNQDYPGLGITAAQAAGSAFGFPEVAIPAGEAIRYLRAHPETAQTIGDALQKQNQLRGQSRFGLD